MLLRSIQLLRTSGLWSCLRLHSYCRQTPRSQSDTQHRWRNTDKCFHFIPFNRSSVSISASNESDFMKLCSWWKQLWLLLCIIFPPMYKNNLLLWWWFTSPKLWQRWVYRDIDNYKELVPDHVRKVHSFWEGAEDLWSVLAKTTPISNWRFCSQRLNRERQIWSGIPASTCVCERERNKISYNVRPSVLVHLKTCAADTCVIPVSSVQNSDRMGCSWGWT